MIPGSFKHRAELVLLAALLVVGGWSVEALIYVVVVIGLAMASASLIDVLLVAARTGRPESMGLNAGRPWLVVVFALVTAGIVPGLVLGEFAPPLALVVYVICVVYFGGPFVREYVALRNAGRHRVV